ncbi:MAG: hypothetical protein Q7O66_02520, partial [Dehalococcoidia bacterium]|nr:hypothetical protein [Dehalococcoidia bacterium]
MADGKEQVEKTIALCKEISEMIQGLSDVAADTSATMVKRLSDMVNILESIQNKVFFRTKTSLNFTIPALGSAQRI